MPIDKSHYLHTQNGLLASTQPADLEALFEKLKADPDADRLVLHFHGGLVSSPTALETASRLLPHYRSAGAYPVFFVWESGLVETLRNNLSEIFDEKIFQQLLTRVTQFLVAKLLQKDGTRGGLLELPSEFEVSGELITPQAGGEPYEHLPVALPDSAGLTPLEEDQFRDTLEDDYILEVEAEAIANSLLPPTEVQAEALATRGGRAQASTRTLMDPAIIDRIREASPDPAERGLFSTTAIIKGAVSVLGRSVSRIARKRDHGLYTTVVEELLREFYLANAGKRVWEVMKKDTRDAFGDNPERYGGSAFLERLKTHWEGGRRPRILLVGHSAGSIYVCHFIKHAAAILPPEVKFEVAFLAPGVDFRLLADTLKDHDERIACFRLFAMQDELEIKDRLVPVVPIYPRSLLYFVSGVLEDEPNKPITGLQRFYSGVPPYDSSAYPEIEAVRSYIAADPNRAVWSVADRGSGLASSAKRHGDFDDKDEATMQSLHHILTAGF